MSSVYQNYPATPSAFVWLWGILTPFLLLRCYMDHQNLHLYIAAAVELLGIIAAIHAVFSVRTSQGAIAWAISLIFMPFLSLLPYLVFGRSRFYPYIHQRRKADRQMHEEVKRLSWRPWIALAVLDADQFERHPLRPFSQMNKRPILSHNHVRLLINGEATFTAIVEAIARARQVVLVQFFIIKDDVIGKKLQQVLCERAEAGVEIYLLYDSIGSHALPRAYVERLEQAGIQVRAFTTRGGLLNCFQLNFRNHRKIVVVDGQFGYVGGHNVGDEYLGGNPRLSPWRDTHVEVQGPVVARLQESFSEDWYWASGALPNLLPPRPYEGPQGMVCQVVTSGPADTDETGSLFFVQCINLARNRVWLTSPYFVPDQAVMSALRLAVLRGVEVRLLLPSRPDHLMVYSASQLYAVEVARMGVQVYRYQPGFVHQKVVLVDDNLAAVGSANLDNRSFRLNFEIMVMVENPEFARQVEQMLLNDFSQSLPLDLKTGPKPAYLQQLGMSVARLVAPVL